MPTPMTTTAYGQVLVAIFRELFDDRYKRYPKFHEQIFNMKSSSKAAEHDIAVSGFGPTPEVAEGAAVEYDEVFIGNQVDYVHLYYGLGFRITDKMMGDSQYEAMKKKPKGLARSANYTIENVAANVFNNGVTTNGFGGVPLFSSAHPRLDKGGSSGDLSRRNQLSTLASLSVTSLQSALNDMALMQDDRGNLIQNRSKFLVHHPNLRSKVHELLQSTLKPGTANNDSNYLHTLDIVPISWPFLTSSTMCFLLTEKDDHEFNFFRRKEFKMTHKLDFDTDDFKFKGKMAFSAGYSDWRPAFLIND